MLKQETEKFCEELDEVMELVVKEAMDVDTIKCMDERALQAIKKCLDLVESAKRITLAQADVLDDMNNKLDRLLAQIEHTLLGRLHHVTLLLPYSEGGVLETLHNKAQVLGVEYTPEGIAVETVCSEELYGRLRGYVKEPSE